MEHCDVIKRALVSEKSIAGTTLQQYTFEVHPDATKTQIRRAVKAIFAVSPVKVNTSNLAGKRKTTARRGTRVEGKRSDWKKAIVTLQPGEVIELNGVNYFQQ
jgi:large subunit ribosomal protein L23